MTKLEMTDLLTKIGYDDKEITAVQNKFDIDKITETVENSSSVEEAIPAINALYPEIEIEKLQEQLDFIRGQVEAAFKEQTKTPVELTSEEIDNISGGGIFSDIGNFFKDHWKAILIGAAIVVGAAVALAVIGGGIGFLASAAAWGSVAGHGAISTISALGIAGTMTCTGVASATLTGAAIGAEIGSLAGVAGAVIINS